MSWETNIIRSKRNTSFYSELLSHQIDNINTELNKKDIVVITLQLNNVDIQKLDELEICDIAEEITSKVRTVFVLDASSNKFSFIDSKVDARKKIFLSRKYMNDLHAIHYLPFLEST